MPLRRLGPAPGPPSTGRCCRPVGAPGPAPLAANPADPRRRQRRRARRPGAASDQASLRWRGSRSSTSAGSSPADCHPAARRLRRHRGAGRVRHPDRRRAAWRPSSTTTPARETSLVFATANAGKLGLTIDLERPEARPVMSDLVAWADVVVEAFSPRAMKLGPGLRRAAGGQPRPRHAVDVPDGPDRPAGPVRRLRQPRRALCGYYSVTGWPDRPPVGPFGAYTDYFPPPAR